MPPKDVNEYTKDEFGTLSINNINRNVTYGIDVTTPGISDRMYTQPYYGTIDRFESDFLRKYGVKFEEIVAKILEEYPDLRI